MADVEVLEKSQQVSASWKGTKRRMRNCSRLRSSRLRGNAGNCRWISESHAKRDDIH